MKNICQICHKEFESIKSTKKYCSNECHNKARRIAYANRPKTPGKREYTGDEKICPICNTKFKPKNSNANQRICCYDCMPDGVQLTRSAFLAKIKKTKGGKCVRCGYDKCISALEFHHTDPTKKEFTISNDHFKLREVIEEIKKCILICSNCHKEYHAGLWELEELEKKEEVGL